MSDYQKLSNHKNGPNDYQRAKELRKQSPLAEQILWNKLRNIPSNSKIRFRRQHPLHPYIVDFICLKAKLVIELDGYSHNTRQDYDRSRDTYLKSLGYNILRFSNDDVMKNGDGIAMTIMHEVERLLSAYDAPLPQPLPQGEGSIFDPCGKERNS